MNKSPLPRRRYIDGQVGKTLLWMTNTSRLTTTKSCFWFMLLRCSGAFELLALISNIIMTFKQEEQIFVFGFQSKISQYVWLSILVPIFFILKGFVHFSSPKSILYQKYCFYLGPYFQYKSLTVSKFYLLFELSSSHLHCNWIQYNSNN